MDSATWTCISPGESWELVCEQGKAHVMKSGDKVIWLVDGGAVDEVASVEAAMDAAERALGLNPRRGVDGGPLPGSTAPEAGDVPREISVPAEDEDERGPVLPDVRTLQRRMGRLIRRREHLLERSKGYRPGESGLSYDAAEASALRTAILLFQQRIGELDAQRAAAVTPLAPPTQPLIARIAERSPAETRAVLEERAASVGRYSAAIRDLTDVEEVAPAVLAELLADARSRAGDVVEGALEALRERERALAMAQTRKRLAEEELKRAREACAEEENAIDRIKDRVIRPICEAAGTGATHAIKAATGRVHIQRNPPSVQLAADPDLLDYLGAVDPRLIRVKREPDKEAIKEWLLAEEEAATVARAAGDAERAPRLLPGATLIRSTRVEVRG